MLRIRLLQVVLPVLLVLFVVWLALELRNPGTPTKPPPERDGRDERQITWVEFVESQGGERTLSARVERLTERGETIEFEGIRDFTVYRDDRQRPVEIDADRGILSGPLGARRIDFEGDVVFRDLRDGLTLRVPDMRVDEAAGEAYADGEIRIDAGRLGGNAGALVYGLEGQPTRFETVDLGDEGDGRLRAEQALLFDGLDDVELVGSVEVTRGADRFLAERARVRRDEGRIRSLRADGRVRLEGTAAEPGSAVAPGARGGGDEVEAEWRDDGALDRLRLRGGASLALGDRSLHADEIEAAARRDGAGWRLGAVGTVTLQGELDEGRGWLRCDRLQATADADGDLEGAEAVGGVRFEGGGAQAEASRATLRDGSDGPTIVLHGTPARKARLVRGRFEVAAVQIRTDTRGDRLDAEGKVAASMLPGDGESSPLAGMFRGDDATHFVAHTLESRGGGDVTVFRGTVRAWQGERNLSAESIELLRDERRVRARERVASRFPRAPERAGVREDDFVQIVSDALDYDDARRRATYDGAVRVRITEGWVETSRLEVDLSEAGELSEIRGTGNVRLEFVRPEDGQRVRGTADRIVYVPDEASVVLHGDSAPATVRQDGAGETRARVLRYRLDTGSLAVDAGGDDQGSIRTKGSP